MRRPERRHYLIVGALALAAGWGTPILAADPPPDRRLKELESALEKGRSEQDRLRRKADALTGELRSLREEMVGAARQAQGFEESLSDLEARLAELAAAESRSSEALALRQQQLTGVLTAIQRLAWRPSESLIAQPASPADTVRSAILLRAALPQIEASASRLRAELAALTTLREDIARQKKKIASTAQQLEAEQKRLKSLVTRKSQVQQSLEEKGQDSEKRLTRLTAEAAGLRDLLARLEEESHAQTERLRRAAAQPPPEKPGKAPTQTAQLAVRPSNKGLGELPLPARGRVLSQFGDASEVGTTHKGITIETRNGAQVVAPHDGRVLFAGPFRGYGQLLILEHGEGYHTLLAGMARIDGAVGQTLVAGEPVGIMGDGDGKPTLYLELRRNGQPVNPLPWLTTRKDKDKVSG